MRKRLLLTNLLLLFFASTFYAQEFDDNFQPFITRPGDIQQIEVLDDGRFLAAGAFSLANEFSYRNIARFFPDGSVDHSFNFNLDFAVSAMTLQDDGKIVIGGSYTGSDAPEGITIIRLMPDGSVDPSFQAGFAPDGTIEVIAIEFNGTILVGGAFNSFAGQTAQGLARLAPEGFLLQTLSLEPSGTVFISDIIVTGNGRFYVAGSYNMEGYLSYRTYGGVPLNDFNFSPSFPGVSNIMVGIRDIEMDSQGRIVLTTSTFLIRYALVIINPDGSYGDWGYIYGIPMDMIVDGFDNIMIAGEYEGVNAVHRFVPGQDLIVYNGGTGCDGLIRQLAETPTGSYIIGGSFSAFNATKALSLERLDGFGNPVANFNPTLERPGFVRATLVVDDKMYIGGDFAMINDHYSPNIARINLNDGSTDLSFTNPELSYRNIIHDIAIDNFDRILLAGTNQNDGDTQAESPLVRILPDGLIDPTFNISTLPVGSVSKVLPIPGGLIMATGDFTIFDPGVIVASQAALFTANGTRINDFSERLDAERISTAFRQADGRLLLAGKNISYDNNSAQSIIRLTAALEFDASFTPPASLDCDGNCRYTITQQSNGQLLIGGQIYLDDQTDIVRLNLDGSNDASFSTPGPFLGIEGFSDGKPRSIKQFADGRLLVTGLFDSLGVTPATSKCILSPEGDLIENFEGLSFSRQSILGGHILDEESFLIHGVLANVEEQYYAGIAKVNFSPPVPNKISGTLTAWFGPTISNAEVGLIGTSTGNTLSDANGYYEFSDLTEGGVYEAIPMLNTEPLNGVSTLDLILISQHILGVAPFTSPYQFLAGDVNNSQSITILDLASIRSVVLGINMTFEDNTSWRFIPSDYTFPSNTNPWLEFFPESYIIPNLTAPGPDNINFTGLKIGDVSGDAETQAATPASGRSTSYFHSQPTLDAEHDMLEVPFYKDDLQELAGFQFTVAFDASALALSGIKHGVTQNEHFGLSFLDEGYITVSWNSLDMTTDISGPLFTLLFHTNSSTNLDISDELISINSAITKAEAYTPELNILEPVFNLTPDASDALKLFSASPNPFTDQAALRFHLPQAGQVQLSFYSSEGKLLKETSSSFAAGNNEYVLERVDLPQGIIYYTLAYDGQLKYGKIVAVDN